MFLSKLFRSCTLSNSICHQRFLPTPSRFLQTYPSLAAKKSLTEELGLPNPPAKPLLPFTKYISQGHQDLANLSWSERSRKLTESWNKQTDEEKAQRLKEYDQEKKDYELQYRAYLSQLTAEQLQSLEQAVLLRRQNKDSKTLKKQKKVEMESLGKPKNPANGFLLFMWTLDRGDHDRREFFVHTANKWRALSPSERQSFLDKGRRNAELYKQQLDEWEKRMAEIGRFDLVRKKSSHYVKHTDEDE